MHTIATALAGFGLGLSLIVAIGAQNAYVLRQGLRAEHVLPVVLVCAVSDALLIAAGVGGLGVVVSDHEGVLDLIRVLGAAFLFGYAILAARRAMRPETLDASPEVGATSLLTVVGTALALTWLNPHVYLDTVLLVGSVAQSYDRPWAFALGASVASVTWFVALGFGARHLRPLFVKPVSWRILDAGIALVMVAIGVSLLVPLI